MKFPEIAEKEKEICKISTAEELKEFARRVNAGETKINAILQRNIFLNNEEIKEDSKVEGWIPIGEKGYEGKFNGNKNGIFGLYINDPEKDGVGLFGYVKGEGKIKKLKLSNVYMRGHNNVGGIAGINEGEIKKCTTKREKIEGNENVGGIIGYNNGRIEDSVNEMTVKGKERVGGDAGINDDFGVMKRCKNEGEIEGEINVGGNAGENIKAVISSENKGGVKGRENIGGNIGHNDIYTLGIVEDCENKGEIEGEERVGGNIGEGKSGAYVKEIINKGKVYIKGYDRDGYDKDGYNRSGYNKEGYNKEGYNKEGYNKVGYNKEGYNKEGYNKEGYNKEGYN